ncbi:MAG TPA: tetratricopeptide repeat protein [Polyangiaceae bacterium]|nr:tetratricopeptide repeat protein [Polyangiaceae bacterium]
MVRPASARHPLLHGAFCAVLALACARQSDILGQARLLADHDQPAKARALLEERLREHPDDVEARRLLIRLFGIEGNLGGAREQAELLSKRLGATSPLPWLELGHALELSHRYDEALNMYDRAAEVAPRDPLGPKTGGLRTARWGERELARPRLEEALRRDSRDSSVWHALGVVCVGLGDLGAAEHAYRSGLMADPRALENHVGLATLAFVRERPADALREYDTILAQRPKHTDAMLGRSLALIELRRLDEAQGALDKAAALGANPEVVAKQRRLLSGVRAGQL